MDFTYKIIHYNKVGSFSILEKEKRKKKEYIYNNEQQGCDCLIHRWNTYIPTIIKYTLEVTVIIFYRAVNIRVTTEYSFQSSDIRATNNKLQYLVEQD